MISEPEMEGESGPDGPDLGAEEEPRPKRPRRTVPSWVWAVGGAVAASALWAGGLYVAGLDDEVDTRGYKVVKGLCGKTEFPGLVAELGVKPGTTQEVVNEHSARDRVDCLFATESAEEPVEGEFTLGYQVRTVVELHKKTDPGPEFEADAGAPRFPGDLVNALVDVPGLGEQAYFVTYEGTDEELLTVLDGGVVFTFQLSVSHNYFGENGEDPTPDSAQTPESPETETLRPFLVKDARELMAAVKR